MSAVTAYAAQAAHFILPVIALIVLIRCIASMFYGRAEPETWGHLVTPDGKVYPLLHWECLIGRARSADITLPYPDVANVHAVLMRNDAGEWTVSDLSAAAACTSTANRSPSRRRCSAATFSAARRTCSSSPT